MIELNTHRLTVRLMEPGEGRNHTCRFDRAGYITSVVLDGAHEFCTTEPDNLTHPSSGGTGLCSEIGSNDIWLETPVGERGPKFGVGLMLKEAEGRYVFYHKYDEVTFPVTWEQEGARVTFHTEPIPCRGYALRSEKTVTAEENAVTVQYAFTNVGEKPMSLTEYVHNFVTIDHLPLGPAYRLEIPTAAPQDAKQTREPDGTLKGEGFGFTFTGYNYKAASTSIAGEELDASRPFSWKLTNAGSPASIREETSFTPARIPVWSIDHIISCEAYHAFSVAPGETVTYERRWIFDD